MADRFRHFGVLTLSAALLSLPACSNDRPALAGTGGVGGVAGTGGAGGPRVCDKASVVRTVSECLDVLRGAFCDVDGIPGTKDDTTCWYTCGPDKTGTRTCTCTDGRWQCPLCEYEYDSSDSGRFDCYDTTDAVACPAEPTDPWGLMVPAPAGVCTLPPCKPCGSATATSWHDSGGTPRSGWCICTPRTDDPRGSIYQCATVADWPPQCR